MEKYNNIEYEVSCIGITSALGGVELPGGEPAWRICLSFKRLLWDKQSSNEVFIGNANGWFVCGEKQTSDRELSQLLDHVAAQRGLEIEASANADVE